jgi:hypothetical protein
MGNSRQGTRILRSPYEDELRELYSSERINCEPLGEHSEAEDAEEVKPKRKMVKAGRKR